MSVFAYRYEGCLLDEGVFREAVEKGLSSSEFINLVDSLCLELKRRLQLSEAVTKPAG